MIYDYTNQHIIVYNPAVRYAYVFSLKSKLWGMMLSDIVNNVNSYPEALAMADGNRLVDFLHHLLKHNGISGYPPFQNG